MINKRTRESTGTSPNWSIGRDYFATYLYRRPENTSSIHHQKMMGALATMNELEGCNRGEPPGLSYRAAQEQFNSSSWHYNQVQDTPSWERRKAQLDWWQHPATTVEQKLAHLSRRLYGPDNEHGFDPVLVRIRQGWGEQANRVRDDLLMRLIVEHFHTIDGKQTENTTEATHVYRLGGYDPSYARSGSNDWIVIEHISSHWGGRPTKTGSIVFQPNGEPPVAETFLPNLPGQIALEAMVGGTEPKAYYQQVSA